MSLALGTADGVEADAGVDGPAPADDAVAAGEPPAGTVDVGLSAAGASVRPAPIAEQPATSALTAMAVIVVIRSDIGVTSCLEPHRGVS